MLRFRITIQALNLRHMRLHRSSKPNNRPVPECLTLGALLTPLVLPSATLKLVKNKFYNSVCQYTQGCGIHTVDQQKHSKYKALFVKCSANGTSDKDKNIMRAPEGGFGVAKVFLCPAGTLLDLQTIISNGNKFFNDW